jgi:tetratricopeptide (TPR) repeat protein
VKRADKGDRRGKVWGQLVPYGMVNLGFGTCKECPWRAGANENTTLTVNHDVEVEGQKLPAGVYGVSMIPEEVEWTVIFSKNSTSWGAFFYDPAQDFLRVKVKPAASEYHEFLTYEFTDREPDRAVLALKWEELQVPIAISVPDIDDVYIAEIRKELKNSKGFDFRNWSAAAKFEVDHKKNLPEALAWAQAAVSGQVGIENFQTLATLAEAQKANGMTDESEKTLARALNHRTAGPIDIHLYARTLLQAGKKDEAMKTWQLNAKRFGSEWPVNVGLARGYSAMGNYKEALKYVRLAIPQAPDDANKKALEAASKKLESGKDMNV